MRQELGGLDTPGLGFYLIHQSMESFYPCSNMLVAQGRKAIKVRQEGADSIHTEAQWNMPMGSLETRLLCAEWEQISDLVKDIPLISLQVQRTKISATPWSFSCKNPAKVFYFYGFFFNTVIGIPSITSRSQTSHALFKTRSQKVEHDSNNMGQ